MAPRVACTDNSLWCKALLIVMGWRSVCFSGGGFEPGEVHVKRLIMFALTAALLTPLFSGTADAGDRDKGRRDARHNRDHDRRDRDYDRRDRYDDRRRHDDRYDRVRDRSVRYLGARDVVVIRDYYRPYHRPLPPGVRYKYARDGYLPPGWAKRIRPVPVYVVRDLHPLPRGYSRGIIDGHVVVHNDRGLIVDVAVLF